MENEVVGDRRFELGRGEAIRAVPAVAVRVRVR